MIVKTQLKNGFIKVIPGERFTPFTLACKLNARVILESASFHRGRERWSLLLLKEAFRVFENRNGIFMERGGKQFRIKSVARDILDVLLYFANQHEKPEHDFPFPSGGIGYLTYENAKKFDTVKITAEKKDTLQIPDACFIFGNIFLIFDHYTDTLYLLGLNYREGAIDLEAEINEIDKRINDLDFNFMTAPTQSYTASIMNADGEKERYEQGVVHVKKEIVAGNLIQGVLSRRVYIKTDLPALEAYRSLRSLNPSPYLFYLNYDKFQLFGSSPEVHVKVKNKRVELRPIAGTRKRGKNEEEEIALKEDLLSDKKELAEHLMLVDLARNDLGRVCVPGSVEVTESMVIEKYSHVMHIVSQVEGILKKEKTGIDALRATFPAGTVSGAPKIKAMEIIDTLEAEQRSFYAGVVGWIEPNGDLNTCITIRSAYKKDDTLILQAGAGIVYDSVPEKEYEETSNKLMALAKSVGVEV
ncbi:MAG: anthranilate synthase component I [Spirochaetales bacterium]|nr:anthranilate synthase component I [Spirochaetales bacterium]